MNFDAPGYLPDDSAEGEERHLCRDLTLAHTCLTEQFNHLRMRPEFPAADAAKFRRAVATLQRLRAEADERANFAESQEKN